MPVDPDQPRRAAKEPPPAQALVHALPQAGFPLDTFQGGGLLRRGGAGDGEPLLGHVVGDDAHHILHHPVVAVQAV